MQAVNTRYGCIGAQGKGGSKVNDWILDVLDDLRSFARQNGMPALAQELDQAVDVACREIGATIRVSSPEFGQRRGTGKVTKGH